jgi:hypothetical protein
MSKSAPKAPDYTGAALAQSEGSKEVTEQQTWANRPDQMTPWSNITWQNQPQWDPATGQYINRWQQNTLLNPELQRALDAQMQLGAGRSELGANMMGRAQQEFGQEMDWSQFNPMGGGVQPGQLSPEELQRDFELQGPSLNPAQRYYQDANDAIFNQWADRALPQQARDTDALRTQLYNMGFREGDEGYNRELERLRQAQGDAFRQATYQATIGSGAEAQRMLGMDAATRGQLTNEQAQLAQFGNQAALSQFGMGAQAGGQNFQQRMQASQYDTQRRQQQIAEEMQRRGFSLNEINALISGQQVAMPSMPGFNTAGSAQGPQMLAAAQMQGQSALDAFNAEQAALQGMMSGVGSLAGGFGFSDRNLKTDIVPLGGGWYAYNLFGHIPSVGVMSDEVNPDAVLKHPLGFDMVNYGKL